ncbi:hypothetical protein BKA65DRAFT_238766 [Rhexocercosporidium sp. MPI-PUGE-AT-0058]|nr:hypothetical protein BKA65DRAFT_238766 [Rhexocercosporidium sp. MPI-PUGE-AT-0058]
MVGEPGTAPVQYVKTPSEYKPCVEHTFLFVNESATPKAGKKLGHRKDIRSHVRRHVLTDMRKAVPRRQLGAVTQLVPVLKRGDASGSIRIGELNGDPSKVMDVDCGSKDRGDVTWIEETFHNPTLDLSAELPRGSRVEPQALELDFYTDIFGPSSSSIETDISTSGDIDGPFCLYCGAHRDDSRPDRILGNGQKVKKGSQLLANNGKRGSFDAVSPRDMLGAGRVDPFSCYPGAGFQVHELVDHSVTYLLPGLISDGSKAERSLCRAWFSAGLRHPLLFHALAFAGSIHLDFLRYEKIYPNSQVALSHKLTVIRTLNEVLNDPQTAASRDEIILSILILASHETLNMSRAKSSPFDSPLRKAQWLNVYGNFTHVPEHLVAVKELLSLRGGLDSLELYGLAEIIVGGDVVSSTRNLSKPSQPPLKQADEWIKSVLRWAVAPPRLPVQKISSRFIPYLGYGVSHDMLAVFEAAGAITLAIQHYVEGQPVGLSLSAISRTRTAVQQRILNLPPVIELPEAPLPFVYEVCRLTSIIYGIAVIFPIPNTYLLFQELIQKLQTAIEMSQVEWFGAVLADLYLWVLVIGGIAALDKPERRWYIAQLVALAERMGTWEWSDVERVLGGFLWLESACGPGGRKLWEEVVDRGRLVEDLD